VWAAERSLHPILAVTIAAALAAALVTSFTAAIGNFIGCGSVKNNALPCAPVRR